MNAIVRFEGREEVTFLLVRRSSSPIPLGMQSAHTKPVKSTSSSREIFYSTLAFLDEFHGHVA